VIQCRLLARQLPGVLPPLADELLSSWVSRHADFYGISGGQLLRHYLLNAATLRELDLKLTSYDQRQLAYLFRYDPRAIRNMTQSRGQPRPSGLIATNRPMQVCRRCITRHRAEPATRGARLRSWMEGWWIGCPVCGAAMVDARPLDLLTRADPRDALLVSVAEPARRGEQLMTRAIRRRRKGSPFVVLMRSLLLPRASPTRGASFGDEIPRLLDIIVPGFDRFLHRLYPAFRRPGTLLLPLNVRIPVLAGVARVASQPDHWAEGLLGAAAETARPRLAECLRGLSARGLCGRDLSAARSGDQSAGEIRIYCR
jgi:hypothetical protein